MKFHLSDKYNGIFSESKKVPFHLKQYALLNARVHYVKFEGGEWLSQEIRGRNFSIWVHRFFLKEDVCLYAFFESLCRTINYSRKGSLYCDMIGGGRFFLREGTYHFYCVPPNVYHPCHFTAGEYCFMHLDITDELLHRIDFNPYCKKALLDYFRDPGNNGSQLPACSIGPVVQDVIRDISECKETNKSAYDAFMEHQVSRLLYEFNEQMPKIIEYSRKSHVSRLMDKMLLYIEARLGQALSLDGLAEEAKVSKSTLNRYFREREGNSVMGFVFIRRMINARRLIKTTKRRMSIITKAVGYSDVGEFAKAYRRYFKRPPGDEREQEDGFF